MLSPEIEVVGLLSRNRPSHRKRLSEIFQSDSGHDVLRKGLELYLEGWAEADYLDEGQIFYAGTMFHCQREDMPLMSVFSQACKLDDAEIDLKKKEVAALFMQGVIEGPYDKPVPVSG